MTLTKYLFVAVLLIVSGSAFGIEDTEENRRIQLERYLEAVPPQALMEDLIENAPGPMTLEERQRFELVMREYVNYDLVFEAMRDAMMRNYTAAELKALADFYSQPAARSAMSKMGIFFSEVMPVIQREVVRAFAAEEQARADTADEEVEEAPQ